MSYHHMIKFSVQHVQSQIPIGTWCHQNVCTCKQALFRTFIHYTYTHTRLTALCPGLPGWAGTRKVKPIWISLKQETVSDSGISWAICKSASRSRQITMPAPHHSGFFTGRMPFLPPNQQRQSTEGSTPSKTIVDIRLRPRCAAVTPPRVSFRADAVCCSANVV